MATSKKNKIRTATQKFSVIDVRGGRPDVKVELTFTLLPDETTEEFEKKAPLLFWQTMKRIASERVKELKKKEANSKQLVKIFKDVWGKPIDDRKLLKLTLKTKKSKK